ncbi:MAG: hypothetical protein IID40_06415, partial [Planctomycetes bacterium]|nr:hypothetical protein [Planctomycetota bacterium]
LAAVFSGVGLRHGVGGLERCYPLLGKSVAVTPAVPLGSGWYFVPGQTLALALWTLVPSLTGWALVRLIWIPRLARDRPTYQATVTFARHLGSVYFYVYVMIVMGASLMAVLVTISPAGTESFRWYLWCFLFGESFFVPTVMWTRLMANDSRGEIFGRSRHVAMGLFVVLFVAIPIWGMTQFLD